MNLSLETQATLLLTAHFARPGLDGGRPLSATEWRRLDAWLKEAGHQLAQLLQGDLSRWLRGWNDPKIPLARIEALLSRGAALALALERWQRVGLWVLTQNEDAYPRRWLARLGVEAPPLLFGAGPRNLLETEALAVVGSRAASDSDLGLAERLGARAAEEGITIVSGAARGVDEAAMVGALRQGGTVVGVLADGLLRATSLVRWRQSLLDKNLVLVSPFHPEVPFEVGNAMARNRLVYCLSEGAVVVTSEAGQGGTWRGATENLRRGWVSVWVNLAPQPSTGNLALLPLGARGLPVPFEAVRTLLPTAPLPATPRVAEAPAPPPKPTTAPSQPPNEREAQPFFEMFLTHLKQLSAEAPTTVQDVADRLDLEKAQVDTWVKRAVSEGYLRKLAKPVRYQWLPQQEPLRFGHPGEALLRATG